MQLHVVLRKGCSEIADNCFLAGMLVVIDQEIMYHCSQINVRTSRSLKTTVDFIWSE